MLKALSVFLVSCAAFLPPVLAADAETGLRISEVAYKKAGDTKEFPDPEPSAAEPLHVQNKAIVTQDDVESCKVYFDDAWTIFITLTPSGREKFAVATRELKYRKLAVLVGERVITAPVLVAAIEDGHILLTGRFTEQKARRIATIIESSRKPAK